MPSIRNPFPNFLLAFALDEVQDQIVRRCVGCLHFPGGFGSRQRMLYCIDGRWLVVRNRPPFAGHMDGHPFR
jgi:hypothetical protein